MTIPYALLSARRGRTLRAHLTTLHAGLLTVCALGLLSLLPVVAAAAEPTLYDRVKSGTTCEKSEKSGRYCEYKIDGVVEIGIKDVGGEHTVIGFHHSNVDAELYAVFYGGCVAIVPGKSNKAAHHRDYGIFISPKTGEVYRASVPCEDSLK